MHNISDTKIQKVGAALREVSQVRKDYTVRIGTATTYEEKHGLQAEAEAAMVDAVQGQGLSVPEFNEMVDATDDDPALRDRVIAAMSAR
jgi:Domain of unknown function (DUF4168)